MRNAQLALVSFVLLAACADQSVSPAAASDGPNLQASGNAVVHRVAVGGPDICSAFGERPGCDGNYSLIALEMADGRVSGEWEDVWGSGAGGIGVESMHATVTCLDVSTITVPLGTFRQAWIGGVVTQPLSLAGHPAITRVRDRGTSANDFVDLVGRTYVDPEQHGLSANCHDRPAFAFGFTPQGQVTIW